VASDPRHLRENLVKQMIELFRAREDLVLVVPAEGTRDRVEVWKSGFYHIAARRRCRSCSAISTTRASAGFGPRRSTGRFREDMEVIRDFYADKTGRHPACSVSRGCARKQSRSRSDGRGARLRSAPRPQRPERLAVSRFRSHRALGIGRCHRRAAVPVDLAIAVAVVLGAVVAHQRGRLLGVAERMAQPGCEIGEDWKNRTDLLNPESE